MALYVIYPGECWCALEKNSIVFLYVYILSNLSRKASVSLLIFCLFVFFWIIHWCKGVAVLNSPTSGLLPIFSPLCLYLVACYIGCIYIYNGYIFLDWLSLCKIFYYLVTLFFFKVYLALVLLPWLYLHFHVHETRFFILSLSGCLDRKWLYCIEYIYIHIWLIFISFSRSVFWLELFAHLLLK